MKNTLLVLTVLILVAAQAFAEDEPDEDDKSETIEFCCIRNTEKISIMREDIEPFIFCGRLPTVKTRSTCGQKYVSPWVGHYFKRSVYEI